MTLILCVCLKCAKYLSRHILLVGGGLEFGSFLGMLVLSGLSPGFVYRSHWLCLGGHPWCWVSNLNATKKASILLAVLFIWP